MFAFQTDIDLETGIDLQSTTEMAVEASEADDMINGGYSNDDVQTTDETTEDVIEKDEVERENDSTLFIYQRAFNPNENAEKMYSLESEDQDTLKEDIEEANAANDDEANDANDEDANDEEGNDDEKDQPNEDVDGEEEPPVESEDQEADVGNNDENNNDNEFDPDLIDEELANEEIKALTNDIEEAEEANDEVIVHIWLKYLTNFIGRSAF